MSESLLGYWQKQPKLRYIGYLPEFTACKVFPKLRALNHVEVLEAWVWRSVQESRTSYTVPSSKYKGVSLVDVITETRSYAEKRWDIRESPIPLDELVEYLQSLEPRQDMLIKKLVVKINPEVLVFRAKSLTDPENRYKPFTREIIQLNEWECRKLKPHSLDLVEYSKSTEEYLAKVPITHVVEEKDLARALLTKLGYNPKRGRVYEVTQKGVWSYKSFEEI